MTIIVSAVLLFTAFSARAEQPPVDEFPAFLSPYLSAKKPLGVAERKWMWMKSYDIALWSQEYVWSYATSFALHIRYASSYSSESLVDEAMTEMSRTNKLTPQEEENDRAELSTALPSVEAGDTMTAMYVPKRPLIIYYNGEPYGRITNIGLTRRFLDVWLGTKTLQPDIAQALKGRAK